MKMVYLHFEWNSQVGKNLSKKIELKIFELDTYPLTPPNVRFTCKMFHPNGKKNLIE
jgi:hypothetical protein